MTDQGGLERTIIGYAVIDNFVKPIYSAKTTVNLAWKSNKARHVYEIANKLKSKARNPIKKVWYSAISRAESQQLDEDESSNFSYNLSRKRLTLLKGLDERRSSGDFGHTLRLCTEESSLPVALNTGDSVSGIVYENSASLSPRTCFVPLEFEVNGIVYAGYEVKGYKPTSNIADRPGTDQPLYISGGMLLEDALRAFDRGKVASLSGRTDPIPLAVAGLPFSVLDIERDSYDMIRELESELGPKKFLRRFGRYNRQLGIYVRGRQTNLDLGMIEPLLKDVIADLGFTPQEYFEFFTTNLLKDLFNLRRAGLMPSEMHERNISILGAIKDEEEYQRGGVLRGEESKSVLAMSVVGYALQHVNKLGQLCGVEGPEHVLFDRFSNIFQGRTTSVIEMYRNYKNFS